MNGKLFLFLAGAAIIVVAGCSGNGAREDGVAVAPPPSRFATAIRDAGAAPAAPSVAEPLRPFFAAGLGFIVFGGVALCFGGRGAGFLLLLLGAATTATGVLFSQYPWTVLPLALAAGATAAFAALGQARARRELEQNREALAATAEVIQNLPEGRAIKAGLSGLGREVEARVRSVVTPIKDKLRREGKIGATGTAG